MPTVDAVEIVHSSVEVYSQQHLASQAHSVRLRLPQSLVLPTSLGVLGPREPGMGSVQHAHILAARTFVLVQLRGHVVVDNSLMWCWATAACRIEKLVAVVSAASNWAVLRDSGPL